MMMAAVVGGGMMHDCATDEIYLPPHLRIIPIASRSRLLRCVTGSCISWVTILLAYGEWR